LPAACATNHKSLSASNACLAASLALSLRPDMSVAGLREPAICLRIARVSIRLSVCSLAIAIIAPGMCCFASSGSPMCASSLIAVESDRRGHFDCKGASLSISSKQRPFAVFIKNCEGQMQCTCCGGCHGERYGVPLQRMTVGNEEKPR